MGELEIIDSTTPPTRWEGGGGVSKWRAKRKEKSGVESLLSLLLLLRIFGAFTGGLTASALPYTKASDMYSFPGRNHAASRCKTVLRSSTCGENMRKVRTKLWKRPCKSERSSIEAHTAVSTVATDRRLTVLHPRYQLVNAFFPPIFGAELAPRRGQGAPHGWGR